MKKPMFSILIPNYGYSPFLFDCLRSVLNQKTDDLFQYEIIICDQSPHEVFNRISKEIKEKYNEPSIKIIHSDIKGLLKARHTLMKHASGDYIQFVDSDDAIDRNHLLTLYKIFKGTDTDVVVFGWKQFRASENKLIYSHLLTKEQKNNFLDYVIFSNQFNSIWRKSFRKKLYDLSKYCYFETTNGEDKNFSIPIVKAAKNIKILDSYYPYFYRENPASMVRSIKMFDAYSSLFVLRDIGFNVEKMTKFQCKIHTNSFLILLSSSVRLMDISFNESKKLFNDCREYLLKLPFNNVDMFKNRIKYFLLIRKIYFLLYILCKI